MKIVHGEFSFLLFFSSWSDRTSLKRGLSFQSQTPGNLESKISYKNHKPWNLEILGKFCTKHGNLETKISHKNRKPWKSREIRKSLHKTCEIDVGETLGIQETKIWARKSTKPFGNQDVQGIAQKKQNRFWLPRYHTKA